MSEYSRFVNSLSDRYNKLFSANYNEDIKSEIEASNCQSLSYYDKNFVYTSMYKYDQPIVSKPKISYNSIMNDSIQDNSLSNDFQMMNIFTQMTTNQRQTRMAITKANEIPKVSWNEEFQQLWDLKGKSPQKSVELVEFQEKFRSKASFIARTIISELNLPNYKKTIKEATVGGIAGGTKFVSEGIFVKIALSESTNLYGDLNNAQKAAGHEIRIITYISKIIPDCAPKLHFPLCQVVDYLGYRAYLCAELPIDKYTLVYGSNDGGKTYINADSEMEEQVNSLYNKLNFPTSHDGSPSRGPFDLEGHRGKDGRLYLLDYARICTPQFPIDSLIRENSIERAGSRPLYELFRPEFLSKMDPKCNPDCLIRKYATTSSKNDCLESTLNFLSALPKLASSFCETYDTEIDQIVIKKFLHSNGINLRYLGLFLGYIPKETIHFTHAFISIITRTLRYIYRKFLLSHFSCNNPDVCSRHVVHFINLVFDTSTKESANKSKKYWVNTIIPTSLMRFPMSNETHKMLESEGYHIVRKIDPSLLLNCFIVLCGIITRSHTNLPDKLNLPFPENYFQITSYCKWIQILL